VGGSCLAVYTVNASRVGEVRTQERIYCLSYSSVPEGRAVNVIAGGLSDGTVRSVNAGFYWFWNKVMAKEVILLLPIPVLTSHINPNLKRK